MKCIYRIGIVLCALALLSTSAVADELGFVTADNSLRAEIAGRIFGSAFARVGERFLVSVTAEQKDSLAHYGIPYEMVLEDGRAEQLSLVSPRDYRATRQLDLTGLGHTIELGGGLYLAETTPSSAAAEAVQEKLFVVSLVDRSVAITYVPLTTGFRVTPMDGFPTDTLVNKISRDSIYAFDKRLEDFYTRHITKDSIRKAREWIVSKFQAWGYTQITTPTFSVSGTTCYNIKVIKPGYAEPDKVIVVGGHYDAINFDSPGYEYCPGADDDASGTVVTMELARVLKNVPLRKTVVFMPFSAEEQGLYGSAAAASSFRSTNTLLEVMLNYDMVGFTRDAYNNINLSSGPNASYLALEADAATRLTGLIPTITSMGTSSDHYSFYQQGYNIVDCIEGDFNTEGWHTNLDVTTRMNFDYFTDVTKMAVATLTATAMAAYPATVNRIVDVGDGSQLQVYFSPCNTGYQYTIYYGTAPGAYTDSVSVTPGACSQVIGGLSDGTRYYFAAYGKPSDGNRAITATEGSEMPLVYPRAPQSVVLTPGEKIISLDWGDNQEADFSYYNVYRLLDGDPSYDLYAEHVTASSFVDSGVVGGPTYRYVITAVDLTGHESVYSANVFGYPATFDGGILVVDESNQDYTQLPSDSHMAAYFDTVLAGLHHGFTILHAFPDTLDKTTAGRYSSIIWDDDDIFNKLIKNSKNTLTWYFTHQTNVFVCGYKTVQNWSTAPIPSSHLLYTEFQVSNYQFSNNEVFARADGQNGWPSIEWDGTRGIRNHYEFPILAVRSGGTVILRNDSPTNNPTFEGQPVGVAYSGAHGKRVLLSVPLFYLTPATAQAFMAKVKEYFGESTKPYPNGDVNQSGLVDLSDLSLMVAYLVRQVPSLPNPNGGDVDHTCFIDISDISRLVAYLTTGKPDLQAGCVTP